MTELYTNIPIAGAIITLVGMFLRHISSERERERQLLGNHLSRMSETQVQIVTLLESLIHEVRRWSDNQQQQ